MSDLDFSALSDDQVLELAVAIAREAVSRHPAVREAFKAAIATEAQRLDAAASGTEAARAQALADVRKSAQDAAYRRSVADASAHRDAQLQEFALATLNAAADNVGRNPRDITVVIALAGEFGDRVRHVRRVLINAGALGEHARWHLCEFIVRSGSVHTSPGLKPHAGALAAWARQLAQDAAALGLDRDLTLIGAEKFKATK